MPNLFALPLSDNSHLSMFSIPEAVEKMFNNLNLKILESGFLPSRKELIDLGVFYFSKKEAIYLIAKKDSKYKRNIDIKENKKLQSLDDFKYDLKLSYAKLSLFEIVLIF